MGINKSLPYDKMKRPKTISELYAQVKDFDIVLTTDAPLASALNREIKTARIGKLAYTPEIFARKYAPRMFDEGLKNKIDIVLQLSHKLNSDIKTTHNILEKILEIEKNTDDVKKYLSRDEVKVYEVYKKIPTLNRALKEFDIHLLPAKVAIIESGFFNNLDKKMIPSKFKEITILGDDEFCFEQFHTFDNEKQMIESAISVITTENQNDCAIILNTNDSVLNLIKSKLYLKNIDINIKEYLHENLNVRVVMDILHMALHITDATVKELRSFLELFKIDIDHKYNNYLITKYVKHINSDEQLLKLYTQLEDIYNNTYKEYLELFKDLKLPIELKHNLQKLQLYNLKITQNNYYELFYFINNFDIEISETKNGVLLADCKSSSMINRQICIYINPDSDWTKQIKNAGYINSDVENENNLKQFKILLKQGQLQFYFATTMKNNQKTIPCFYFNEMFSSDVNGFDNPVFHAIKHTTKQTRDTPGKEIISDTKFNFKLFSQSSLNTLFECPKKFEFSKIAPREEQTYFLKGTLLHGFAEFYVSHKKYCNEQGNDFFVELLINEYMNMIETENFDVERTMFKIGIMNLREYIDSLKISHDANEMIGQMKNSKFKDNDDNFLSTKLDMPLTEKNTEVKFTDYNSKMIGVIDLIINSCQMVDYKSSGAKKTIGSIISNSNLKLVTDHADLQPLFYISQVAGFNLGQAISFYYYFFIQNYSNVINGDSDTSQNVVEIKYYPMTFDEFIISSDGLEIITAKGARKEIISILEMETIISALKKYPIENHFLLDAEIPALKELEAKIVEIKDTKKNRGIVFDFFKEIYRLRVGKSNYPVALFFSEDLVLFKDFVKEKYAQVNEYIISGFPKTPVSKKVCDDCEYKDMCFGRWNE